MKFLDPQGLKRDECLAIITALNPSSSFGKRFVSFRFRKKLKCYPLALVGPYWEKPGPPS